jgi:hypothetical protein
MIKAAMLAVFVVTAAQPASADTWCVRDFGEAKYKNCVFPSLQECLRVVRVAGGVCDRDRSYLETQERKVLRRPDRWDR